MSAGANRSTSFALCNIDIEYGQDLDYVEAVLERELPSLKDNNSKVINVPFPHVTFSRHDPEGRKTVNDLINEKLESMEEEEHKRKDELDELFGD